MSVRNANQITRYSILKGQNGSITIFSFRNDLGDSLTAKTMKDDRNKLNQVKPLPESTTSSSEKEKSSS